MRGWKRMHRPDSTDRRHSSTSHSPATYQHRRPHPKRGGFTWNNSGDNSTTRQSEPTKRWRTGEQPISAPNTQNRENPQNRNPVRRKPSWHLIGLALSTNAPPRSAAQGRNAWQWKKVWISVDYDDDKDRRGFHKPRLSICEACADHADAGILPRELRQRPSVQTRPNQVRCLIHMLVHASGRGGRRSGQVERKTPAQTAILLLAPALRHHPFG